MTFGWRKPYFATLFSFTLHSTHYTSAAQLWGHFILSLVAAPTLLEYQTDRNPLITREALDREPKGDYRFK